MQQLMRLRHIGDVGRCADHAVHQAALGIDPDMSLHAEVPLVPLPGLCISGSRSPVLFLVELGAVMIVASTIVPCRSNRPDACRCAFTVSKISRASPCCS